MLYEITVIISHLVAHVSARVEDQNPKAVVFALGFRSNHDAVEGHFSGYLPGIMVVIVQRRVMCKNVKNICEKQIF